MLQRDYILRMIEQAGEAIRRLRNMILGRASDPLVVRDELGKVLGGYGFDLDFVRAADGNTLFLMVAPTGEVDATRCWVLAESLYLDGLSAHVDERYEEARLSLEKAHLLYSAVAPGAAFYGLDEAEARIAEVETLLTEGQRERTT